MTGAQDLLDVVSGTVAAADPHRLRRRSFQKAELMKIGVLRDDRQAVLGGVSPHRRVIGRTEADVPHVVRPRIHIGEPLHKARREVRSRAAAPDAPIYSPDANISRRPRSAAKAMLARRASAVTSATPPRV